MIQVLFYLVILAANIIQGITGFAGTVLAMPISLILVGYGVAKPVLNVLGILAGAYVFGTSRKHVCIKELKKIVMVMTTGILVGIFIKSLFQGHDEILYYSLGVFIIFLSIQGFLQITKRNTEEINMKIKLQRSSKWSSIILLSAAGIVHGMFVAGGPLLIGYLSKRLNDKTSFRATISTVWIILNTIILIDDIRFGFWTKELIKTQLIAIPFFIVGMVIGTKLYEKMSQQTFMKLTYILMFISGVTLLIK